MDIRNLKVKKEAAVDRMKEQAGDNWKLSRLKFVINVLETLLIRIGTFLKRAMALLWNICQCGAALNNCNDILANTEMVDLAYQKNYIELKKPTDIHIALLTPSTTKQRTEEWFKLREGLKVTGSSIHRALGCETLKAQGEHFDKVMSAVPQKEWTHQQKEAI